MNIFSTFNFALQLLNSKLIETHPEKLIGIAQPLLSTVEDISENLYEV